MNTNVIGNMIGIIRAERDNRKLACLTEEDPDVAGALWLFTEEPVINDMCLMTLVALYHHVERELVLLAARVSNDGAELDVELYQQKIHDEREQLRRRGGRELIAGKLQLKSLAEWGTSIETLRLLANTYKHSPSATPDDDLLRHLGLDPKLDYAPLAESPSLKKALAASLDLEEGSDFFDIAEELVVHANRFLAGVRKQAMLSPLKLRVVPIDQFLL